MIRRGWRCRSIEKIWGPRLLELVGSLQPLTGAMVKYEGLIDASLTIIWDTFMNEWIDV